MQRKDKARSHYRTFHHVFIYITERCQLSCNHCYMGNRLDRPMDMSYEKTVNIMGYCRRLGAENITFVGGEPTLHDDLPQIVNYAVKLGYNNICVDTNGLLIEKLKLVSPESFTFIRVSLDGASAETHSQVRGEGTFEKTISSIEELVVLGYKVAITSTISQCNIHEALNILPLADRLGVSLVNFHVFSEEGRGITKSHWALKPQDWIDFYESIEKVKHKYSTSIWYPPTWTTSQKIGKFVAEGYRGCLGCTLDRLSIFPDGTCYICSVLFDKPFYFGTMTDEGFVLNKNNNEFEIFTEAIFGACESWLSGCPAEKYLEEQGKKKTSSEFISICRCWKSQV